MTKRINGTNKSRAITKRMLEPETAIRGITLKPQPKDTSRETILRIALESIAAMEIIDGAIAGEAKAIARSALKKSFPRGARSYPRCPRKYRPDGSHLFDRDGICVCGLTLQRAIDWANLLAANEHLDAQRELLPAHKGDSRRRR